MNIVIDLIVLVIIVLCALISAKRGFVKVFVEVIGFVAAIIITFTISTPLAEGTYDKIIEPPIIKAVTESIENAGNSIEDSALNALPTIVINNSEKFNISLDSFADKVTSNMADGVQNAVKTASQDVVKPVISEVLGLIYSILILLVLVIAVKFLARVINKMFSFSIIGKANRMLGGLIGIPKGMIIAVLFCMIISLLVSLYGDFLIFSQANLEKTVLYKFFADFVSF